MTASAAELAERQQLAEACGQLRQAISLWRGPVGIDLDSVLLAGRAARLDEELLAAQDRWPSGSFALATTKK